MFATRDHSAVVTIDAKGGAPWEVLGGASVPFARVDAGHVVLVAQRVVDGRMMPVETRSTDLWSEVATVLSDDQLRTCSSPVRGRLAETEVLLCVDEGR